MKNPGGTAEWRGAVVGAGREGDGNKETEPVAHTASASSSSHREAKRLDITETMGGGMNAITGP